MSYLRPRADEIEALTVPCPACLVGAEFWCRAYVVINHGEIDTISRLHPARFTAAFRQERAA